MLVKKSLMAWTGLILVAVLGLLALAGCRSSRDYDHREYDRPNQGCCGR